MSAAPGKAPLASPLAIGDPFTSQDLTASAQLNVRRELKKRKTALQRAEEKPPPLWDEEDSAANQSRLEQWGGAIMAALPLFLLSYSSCVSYAHLIASGAEGYPLSASVVASMHLFSSGLTGLILPLQSQCPLIIPSADISVTIFYQRIVQDIATSALAAGTFSPAEVAATCLLALPLNTVLMSLVLYVVGSRKATVAVSYLPYPVVAGFLGSIGYAIFYGSFAVLKDGVTPSLPLLMHERPGQLCAAAAMALGSLTIRSAGAPARFVAVAPTVIALAGFWITVLCTGASVDNLREVGWLFPASGQEPFWTVWTAQQPELVQWSLIAPRATTFLGLGFVLVLSLTLRIASIEGCTGSAMDIDGEVKNTGLASLGAGMLGTVIGSHSPGLTVFNLEAGSTDSKAAVLTALLQLGLWLSGLPAICCFPRFLLSGILMNLGLVMLLEWMWVARRKVGIKGLMVIYSQVTASVLLGLLPSVMIGAVAACVAAQAQLMSLHVLKYHVSGRSINSHVRRSEDEQSLLQKHAEQIEVLGLEGYLAEGPMIKFSTYLKSYVSKNDVVRYMIFDFEAVQGCNASACALVAKLDKALSNRHIKVFFANVELEWAKSLKLFGVPKSHIFKSDTALKTAFHMALEHCEEQIIIQQGWTSPLDRFRTRLLRPPKGALQNKLQELLECTEEQAAKIIAAGQMKEFEQGEVLVAQGQLVNTLHVAIPDYSEVAETLDVGASCGPPHQVQVERLGLLSGVEGVLFGERARATSTVISLSHVLDVPGEAMKELLKEDADLAASVGRVAVRQLLRHSDALMQAFQLTQGGGWRGGHFDQRTVTVALGVRDDIGNLATPTKKDSSRSLTRKATIDSWVDQWHKTRSLQSSGLDSPLLNEEHHSGTEGQTQP